MAIVRNLGYVQLRRGLFEHVQNGEMTYGECFLYVAIVANADPATGVWISSAGMLSSIYSIPNRTCKDWLSKLEQKRYLRRFMVQGKHSQYPILVHKYQCTDGALRGMKLNAWESTSYIDRKYDACPEHVPDGALTVPQSTREERKEKKKNIAPKEPSENVTALYRAYPKHVARATAYRAIEKALQTEPFAKLLEAVQEFATRVAREGAEDRFIPNPSTWFNGERYNDETTPARIKAATAGMTFANEVLQ